MKKIILSLLIFNSLILSSQNFVTDSRKWNDLHYLVTTCNCEFLYETHSFFIDGDSIINEKSYKILKDSSYMVNSHGSEVIKNLSLKGFIREDVENEQVFFINDGDQTETKIYDFKLELNDIFEIDFYNYVVTNVDSVMYLNTKRKEITLNNENNPNISMKWISGIGSDKGLFYFEQPTYLLLCATDNDELIYQNNQDYDCIYYDVISSVKDVTVSEFNIFPNPAQTDITVSGTSKINSIEILDLMGKVKKAYYPETNSISIDIKEFNSGLYLVKVNDEFYKIIFE